MERTSEEEDEEEAGATNRFRLTTTSSGAKATPENTDIGATPSLEFPFLCGVSNYRRPFGRPQVDLLRGRLVLVAHSLVGPCLPPIRKFRLNLEHRHGS